jgi:hypothetical protein
MKKRLEADLISIAHRILQLKDKSDINQLYLETQKLYEKLSVLKFIEENYGDVKPTIGNYSEIEKEIENIYDKEASLPVETKITEDNLVQETEIVETPEEIISIEEAEMENNDTEFHEQETEEEIEQEIADEVVEIPEFKAAFELSKEAETEIEEIEEAKKPEAVQISFEDLLGLSYNEPEFVKIDEVAASPAKEIVFEKAETGEEEIEEIETPVEKAVETTEKSPSKTVSLNEKFSKGIDIDLNDRIAFVKHLFGNSNEDYNRVMNQLITYDNFYETKSFIDEMVKPDYNNWEGKEEYEERFMELIEKKFL